MPERKPLTTSVGATSGRGASNDSKDVVYIQSLLYLIPASSGGPETPVEMALVRPGSMVDGRQLADLIRKFQVAHKTEISCDMKGQVTPIGRTLTVLQDEADAAEKRIKNSGPSSAQALAWAARGETPYEMKPEETTELENPYDLKHFLLRAIARPSDIEYENSAGGAFAVGEAAAAYVSLDLKQGSDSRTVRVFTGGAGISVMPASADLSSRSMYSTALSGHVFKGFFRGDPKLDDLLGACVVYSGSGVVQVFGAALNVFCLGISPIVMVGVAGTLFTPQVVFPAATAFLFTLGTQFGSPDLGFSVQVGAVTPVARAS